jgi:hypothetical protein
MFNKSLLEVIYAKLVVGDEKAKISENMICPSEAQSLLQEVERIPLVFSLIVSC